MTFCFLTLICIKLSYVNAYPKTNKIKKKVINRYLCKSNLDFLDPSNRTKQEAAQYEWL